MPETRERPTYRRRTTRTRRGAPPTSVPRITIGVLVVVVAVVLTIAGLGAGRPDRETASERTRPVSTKRPEPVAHVTFGAHKTADMPCDSCHSTESEHTPSCRACHGDSCGKGVTTVAGCLECHETGTTDDWDPTGLAPK